VNTTSKPFLLTVAFAMIFAAVGCGKKQTPARTVELTNSPASNAAAATVTANPLPTVQNPIAIPPAAADDNSQVLAALTQALRKYAIERKGMPRNFSEIVSAGYVKNLPAPPPGKKFEIDAKTARVVLVNQ
jgi:hypothetical protein